EVVDPAAFPGGALGLVEQDEVAGEGEVRRAERGGAAVEDAASLTVAVHSARRRGTADGQVRQQRRVRHTGLDAAGGQETATLAVAAVAADAAAAGRAAGAARGHVAGELAVADVDGAQQRADGTAPTRAPG